VDELSDPGLIEILYQHVLDREPEGAGFDYWSQQLSDGLSREHLLAMFSESNENKSNLLPSYDDGIWYV